MMRRLPSRPLVLVLITSCVACAGGKVADDGSPAYRDPQRPVDERVADLLARMTLEEKVAQLLCLWSDKNDLQDEGGRFVGDQAAAEIPLGVGHVVRLADVLGVDLVAVGTVEGAAFGAALLAGVGAGVWETVEQACGQAVELGEITRPDAERSAAYEELYRRFRRHYPALSPLWA